MSYRCVLIDDDEMDRIMLSSIVRKFPQLQIIGVFESAEELLQFDTKKIDVLLLDIDMPACRDSNSEKF
jgi:two-component system LytT family response regulator